VVVDTIKYIRQLAKDSKYQTLFSLGKDLHNINLFENNLDFTDIQLTFLRYLNFYSTIYLDIALGDIDEIVLKNDIYTDSYMMWKNKKDKLKQQQTEFKSPIDNVQRSQWIFKSPKK